MSLSESWFHIFYGFLLGIVCTIFTLIAIGLVKKHAPLRNLANALILFSLSLTLIYYIYDAALWGGILVEWQFLGVPAFGDPAVKVLEIGYIETRSGNIYHSVCIDCQDKNWERVDKMPSTPEGILASITNDCKTLSFLPFRQFDFIDSKSVCTAEMWKVAKIAYAVDDQGQVYSWIHEVGSSGDLVFPWYTQHRKFIDVALASVIFGIIIILLSAVFDFLVRNKRNGND